MGSDKQYITDYIKISSFNLESLILLHLHVQEVSKATLDAQYMQIVTHVTGESLIMHGSAFFS